MKLPMSFYNEIVAHAREGKPNEVCGLIAGRDGSAVNGPRCEDPGTLGLSCRSIPQ